MRKTFLKVALFSLVAAPMVTSFQSCKDYDDDITEINGTTGTLTSQITDLEGQISTLRTALSAAQTDATNAGVAADNARKQAEAALTNAANAMDAAKAAQATGDLAKAAAATAQAKADKAEADAAAANALAQEAKQAAAQAKADALASVTAQAEALRSDIANLRTTLSEQIQNNGTGISKNAADIAANAAAIKANVDKLNTLEARISAIDSKLALYPTTEAMTAAINAKVSEAQAAVLEEVKKNTNSITEANGRIDALNTTVTSSVNNLQSQISTILQQLMTDIKPSISTNANNITSIKTDVAGLQEGYNQLNGQQKDILDKYNSLSAWIENHGVDIDKHTTLTTTVENIRTDLTALQTEVSANYKEYLKKAAELTATDEKLKLQVTALEDYQSTLPDKFETIEGKFTTFDKKYGALVSENAENIADLKTVVDEHVAATKDVLTDISKIQEDLDDIREEWATVKSDIDTKLNDKISEVNTAISGINGTIEAGLQAAKDELTNLFDTTIDEYEMRLSEIIMLVNKTMFEALQEVESKINELEGSLNVLNMLPGRLNTVSFVPDLYVGGIPTIEFMNIQFQPWTVATGDDAAWFYNAPAENAEYAYVGTHTTTAKYRLNPETITAENIKADALRYVSHKATSRSAEVASALTVQSSSISDGILSVVVSNNEVNALTSGSQITVASLVVPIADKYLYPTETAGMNIYSDYTRVAEANINDAVIVSAVEEKEVANKTGMQDALVTPTKDYILKEVAWPNEENALDLNTLVQVTYTEAGEAKTATAADLEPWGLSLSYKLVEIEDNKDQLAYESVQIDGTTLSVKEGNKADIMGRTPIIAAILTGDASNGNAEVVDVKYFMIRFVTSRETATLTIKKEIDLNSKYNNTNWTDVITWAMYEENIFGKLADAIFTVDQFKNVYVSAEAPVSPVIESAKNMIKNPTADQADVNVYDVVFNNNMLNKVQKVGEDQIFTNTITYSVAEEYEGLYPAVEVTYVLTVHVPDYTPTLNDGNDIYWFDLDGMQTIKAVPLDPAKREEKDGVLQPEHPTYGCKLFDGRTAPYVDLNEYTTKDLGAAVFKPTLLSATNGTEDCTSAVLLTGCAPFNNTTKGYKGEFTLNNTDLGKSFIANADKSKAIIAWSIYPLGTNLSEPVKFAETAVVAVQPLTLTTTYPVGDIVDATKDTELKLMQALNLVDYYGNSLIQYPNTASAQFVEDLTDYYAVTVEFKEPTIDGITMTDLHIDMKVNPTTGVLTYNAANSPAVANVKTVTVPVTLTHWWGTLTGEINFTINPKN